MKCIYPCLDTFKWNETMHETFQIITFEFFLRFVASNCIKVIQALDELRSEKIMSVIRFYVNVR